MVRATWNGVTIAESDATVAVEGNHYFPISDVRRDLLRPSSRHTTCSWKGVASYHDVGVGDHVNRDAAWFYPDPRSTRSQSWTRPFSIANNVAPARVATPAFA